MEARYRAESGGLDAAGLSLPDIPALKDIGDLPGVQAINDAVASMNRAITDSREKFADAFEYGIDAALRGDWQGVLRSIFGDIMSGALKNLGRSIFDRAGGASGGGFNWGTLLSSFKIPGFARGGSFTVGGSGTTDSKLAMMKVTPGERVDVSTVRQQRQGSGGGNSYTFSGNLMTPEFWGQIQSEIAAGEGRANAWAAQNVPALTHNQASRFQRYSTGRKQR
ncbi:hypothetical protein ACFPIF_02495 [Brevundimonas faecalis]|uniref:hypothetical protein n=1 Tax=Brevundimonas faecalis TaxID=947378 RepID=UPI003610CEA9